jgi:hypothetical protein
MTDHESVRSARRDSLRVPGKLAKQPPIERTWLPDRESMLAALRVALELPRVISFGYGDER